MSKLFTLTVFTENRIGMLNRITGIFTRRHLNIESLTTSETEVKDVYRYTIVVRTTEEQVHKLVAQIEKSIEVIKAFVQDETDIVHQEIALYKLRTNTLTNNQLEQVIRENYARILTLDADFLVIEKTGHDAETQALFEKLKPFGLLEFVRSGRVAVSKSPRELSSYLAHLESV